MSLSTAMRDMLPLRALAIEAVAAVGVNSELLVNLSTSVWEDNEGCLKLARMRPPRMTPHSKHYALKYHWFRAPIRSNHIEIESTSSDRNLGDIMTKALRVLDHLRKRKLLMN